MVQMFLADHVTPATGKTLTVTLSKDGAAFASISPTVTERGTGWYNVALVAANTDTVGDLVVLATEAACDPTSRREEVVADAGPIAASVNDASATTSSFVTTLPTITNNNHWKDGFITFVTGSLTGQTRKVLTSTQASNAVSTDAFTAAPANGDKFVFVND